MNWLSTLIRLVFHLFWQEIVHHAGEKIILLPMSTTNVRYSRAWSFNGSKYLVHNAIIHQLLKVGTSACQKIMKIPWNDTMYIEHTIILFVTQQHKDLKYVISQTALEMLQARQLLHF